MAIAFVTGATEYVDGAGVDPFTSTTGLNASGSAMYVVVGLSASSATPPSYTTVKWGGSGGTTMSAHGTASATYNRVAQYGLKLGNTTQSTGTGSKVYVDFSAAPDEFACFSIVYSGVHQTTSTGTAATNTGASTTATVNASSATGELVVDTLGSWDGGSGSPSIAAGSGQTSRQADNAVAAVTGMVFGASEEAGASTVTMSWTTNSSANWFGIVATPLKPYADPTAALTGTATSSITESDIVTGGKTVVLTLTDDTYVPAAGTPTFSTATAAGTTTADGRTGDGALTINWPTGYTPVTGHFAVAVVYSDQGAASVPTDWSRIGSGQFGGGTEKLDAFYKVLASSDLAPSTTISGSGTNVSHCAGMLIYTGVGSIGAVGTASNGTGTPMTAGAITTTADGSIVLGLCGRGDNETSSGQTLNSSATGVTERLDAGTSAGNDAQVSAYDKTITTSGTSSGDGSATTSTVDPWVSVLIELKPSTPFANARSAIASGLDSAQSEATGWDAKVKPNIPVANVVRTSNTVCTITLQAQSDYNITATETITATIPAAALSGGAQIVATPTFTIGTASGQYTYTGSGGLTLAGAATLAKEKVPVASGGLTLAGAADKAKTKAFVGSGGITFAGAATTAKVSVRSYTASGGLTLAGAADLAKTKAATATGGITLAGAAGLEKTKAFAATGGITFGGAAVTSYAAAGAAHEYVGSGGIAFAGAAALAKEKSFAATGGLTLAGAAELAKTKALTATGGITFGGAATTSITSAGVWEYVGSGGIAFAGAATLARTKAATASGGLTFAGSATTSFTQPGAFEYIGSGGLTFAGQALLAKTKAPIAAGGIAFAGAGITARVRTYAATGGITFAGAGVTAFESGNIRSYVGSGGMTFAGAATLAKTKAPIGSGGITFAGSAVPAKVRGYLPSGGITFAGAGLTWFTPTGTREYTGSGGMTFAGASPYQFIAAVPAGFPDGPVRLGFVHGVDDKERIGMPVGSNDARIGVATAGATERRIGIG